MSQGVAANDNVTTVDGSISYKDALGQFVTFDDSMGVAPN